MFQLDMKRDIGRFTNEIRALRLTLSESIAALKVAADLSQRETERFLKENFETCDQAGKITYCFRNISDGPAKLHDQLPLYNHFRTNKEAFDRSRTSVAALPRFLFLVLAELHSAYHKALIKSVFCLRPELLASWTDVSEPLDCAPLRLSDMAGNPDEEREVGNPVDRGLDVLFAWLDSHLGKDLRNNFTITAELVEVTERGNLFACNGGIVSDRYVATCGRNGIPMQNINLGDRLEVSADYFFGAADLIFSAGVKLGHLLWRKLIPEQIPKANAILQDLIFSLIQEKQYTLAGNLLDFANGALLKDSDENNRRVFLINGALAAYLVNDKKKCNQLLDSADWSSTAEVLQLAHAVLTEQFQAAATLMRKIGGRARPSRSEYLRWPLFETFRETQEFALAFEEIFGPITLTETEVR